MFEDYRYERTLTLVLSLTDEGILKQSGFTENELKRIKNFALQKVHRQKSFEGYKAMELLDNK